jgi:DNA-binding CsgD family transcriptional regulator
MTEDLLDKIYEAAFVPEFWPNVLNALSVMSGSESGAVIAFDGVKPVGFCATGSTQAVMQKILATGSWQKSQRIPHFQANPFTGFVSATEYFPASVLEDEESHVELQKRGLGEQLGTIIPMPTGEMIVYIVNRETARGAHDQPAIDAFDGLYPHLARAGLVAARLGLERAHNTVTAFETIGLPAAVLNGRGRVLAANKLLDALPSVFTPVAHGGLAITNGAADVLFQSALGDMQGRPDSGVLSIPVPAQEDRPGLVIHVLPLRRAAHDIFSGGERLVVATQISASQMVPSPSILTGLFDLTPAETRLAIALSSGHSLKKAAELQGITFSTARSYLEQIFRKTGTKQQSQLVALLKSAHPLVQG